MAMLRVLTVAAAAMFALLGPATAQRFDTPKALLEALYAPYLEDGKTQDFAAFRSAQLNALYDARIEADGYFDFNPLVLGQDWALSDFAVGPVDVQGDSATAHVSFNDFDTPTELDYSLVNEDGWKIDNISSAGDAPFSLVDMLSAEE